MGCGLSDKAQDYSYTHNRRIEDVQKLLKHTNMERYNLIVHDWGRAIGMGVAVQNPEKWIKLRSSIRLLIYLNGCHGELPFLRIGLLGSFLMRAFNLFACVAVFMSVCKPLRKDIQKGFLFPYQEWNKHVPWHDLLKIFSFFKMHLMQKFQKFP